jgi:rhomboid protease GluP
MSKCIQCGRNLPGLTFGKKLCQWCVQHEAAQRGEESEDAKQIILPAPWVRQSQSGVSLTQILLGVNVAVFLLALASPAIDDLGANFGPLTMSGQWWRLVTYMFLHSGFIHIAFNMWCLWDLGALCESLYGRATFAAIYLITGVAGGVATIGWRPFGATVGASGAIFGLAGALVASFYLGEFSLPSSMIRGTLRSLAFFVVINVVLGGVFPGVDNACHIGGLISGAILGALIARIAPERDQVLQRTGILLVVALIVIASAVGVFRWRGSQIRFETEPDSRIFSQVTPRARA